MGLPVHTINQGKGSTAFGRLDQVTIVALAQLAYPAGNGDPASVVIATPGVAYATIPTAAFANAGLGSGATLTVHMKALTATVVAGGTGGTNGAVTVTGTTGTGTKFQATGTITGNALAGPLVVSVAGDYTALPSTLAAEPVTGGSLSGCTVALTFGVLSVAVGGSSNHAYPQGTTAAFSGGTPVTAATFGAVTVTPVAGQGCSVTLANLSLPANYAVLPGDIGISGDCYISGRSTTGFTVNIAPGSTGQTLAAGAVDLFVIH